MGAKLAWPLFRRDVSRCSYPWSQSIYRISKYFSKLDSVLTEENCTAPWCLFHSSREVTKVSDVFNISFTSDLTSNIHIHLFLAVKMGAAICKFYGSSFRSHPCPAIFSWTKQFVLLLDIENWCVLSYYLNVIS